MSIHFSCPSCARDYSVDGSLAGKRARCKHCGTEMRIPAATAPAPRDLYDLDEGPAAAPAPKRSGYDAELDTIASPSAPRRATSRPGRAPATRRPSAEPAGPSPVRKLGFGLITLGALSFVLPFVGLQVKGLHRMSPEAQQTGGVVLLVLGGILVGLSYLTGAVRAAKPVIVGGLAVVGVLFLLFIVSVGLRLRQAANHPGPSVPAGPGPFAAGQPASAPAGMVPPWERGPESDLQVALSNGRFTRSTTPLGGPMPGVEVQVDYQVTGGKLSPGERPILVIRSRQGRGELDNLFELQRRASGTIGASSFSASPQDGPYEAWLEVGTMFRGPNERRKKVSDTITLTFVDVPVRDSADIVREQMDALNRMRTENQPPVPGPPPGFGPPAGFPGPRRIPGPPPLRVP